MVVFSSVTAGAAIGVVTSAVASWMGIETYRDYNKNKHTKLWWEWSIADVAEFVSFLGPKDSTRWNNQYPALIHKFSVDGEALAGYNKQQLQDLGFRPKDAAKILRAFAVSSQFSAHDSPSSGRRDEWEPLRERTRHTFDRNSEREHGHGERIRKRTKYKPKYKKKEETDSQSISRSTSISQSRDRTPSTHRSQSRDVTQSRNSSRSKKKSRSRTQSRDGTQSRHRSRIGRKSKKKKAKRIRMSRNAGSSHRRSDAINRLSDSRSGERSRKKGKRRRG